MSIKVSQKKELIRQFKSDFQPVAAGVDTYLQYNNGGILGASSGLSWNDGNAELLIIGKLGIGSIDPTAKLMVDGDINFTGKLYQNGSEMEDGFDAGISTSFFMIGV
jgi:hypothetical protein